MGSKYDGDWDNRDVLRGKLTFYRIAEGRCVEIIYGTGKEIVQREMPKAIRRIESGDWTRITAAEAAKWGVRNPNYDGDWDRTDTSRGHAWFYRIKDNAISAISYQDGGGLYEYDTRYDYDTIVHGIDAGDFTRLADDELAKWCRFTTDARLDADALAAKPMDSPNHAIATLNIELARLLDNKAKTQHLVDIAHHQIDLHKQVIAAAEKRCVDLRAAIKLLMFGDLPALAC